MKNKIKLFIFITLTATAGFSLAGCDLFLLPKRINITVIPEMYSGMLGALVLSQGNTDKAYVYPEPIGGDSHGIDFSHTFNLLDWETEKPFTKDGTYTVKFLVYEDTDAAEKGSTIWSGQIPNKNISEETTSINYFDFPGAVFPK